MADTLESLEIEVKHSATNADAEIAKVTSQIREMSKALTEAIPQLKQYVETLNKVSGKAKSSVPKAASQGSPLPQGLQEAISNASKVDVLQEKLVSLRAAMEQAFNAGDADKAYSLRGQILQTEAALAKAEKAAGTTGRSFREMAKDAAKSNSPLKKIVESLKRIAFYRIIRSVIKDIGQAFQEGLEKAYLFSAGMTGAGHRFAAAMDNIKSAGNAMKAQLGAAFIALYAAVEPILIAIINLVTRVADAISQLLSAFTGTTYLKANATAAQFVDTMKAGGAAAKEWKNQLLGFDEINRLEEPSNGGGGGGTNPLKGYEMEDTPIAEKWLKIANAIKSVIAWIKDHLDLVLGVAEAIGVAILGWKLVGFLNGLLGLNLPMSKILGLAIAIGGAFLLVRGVVDAIKNGVNWDNLMEMIGGTLGLTLGLALAFGKVGGAIGLLIGSIAMLVAGVMDWIKTKELSDEAFAAIEIGIAGVSIALSLLTGSWIPLAIGGVAAFAAWFTKHFDEIKRIVSQTWQAIKDFFRGLKEKWDAFVNNEDAVNEALNTLEGAIFGVALVLAFATGGWSLLVGAIAIAAIEIVRNWDKIKAGWDKFMEPLRTAWDNLKTSWGEAIDSIKEKLQGFIDKIHEAWDAVQRFFGWGGPDAVGTTVNEGGYSHGGRSKFATGGFPDEGQMFIAREAGPEMVGTIGGRTAVANNDDIVESIRAGVYEAVMAGMGNGGSNSDVNLKVYLDSREIRAGLQRLDRAWGA